MTLEEIRNQVRFKVGDNNISPPVFEDSFYDTEIQLSKGKINSDVSIDELDVVEAYMVILSASIQMCYARASLQVSKRSFPDITTEDIKKLDFDDIGAELWDTLKPVKYWIDLAEGYKKKLDALIKESGLDIPEIFGAENMVKIDRNTDGEKLPIEEYRQATPVTLTFDSLTDEYLTLKWTINRDSDFLYYKIYATNEGTADYNDTLIFTSSDRTELLTKINLQNILERKSLSIGNGTSLKLYIWNTRSNVKNIYDAGSNEVVIDESSESEAIILSNGSITDTTIVLNWTKYIESDFYMYEVYRSTGTEVDNTDTLIYSSYNSDDLTFTDTGLTTSTEYSYIVCIWKKGVNNETLYNEFSNILTVETI